MLVTVVSPQDWITPRTGKTEQSAVSTELIAHAKNCLSFDRVRQIARNQLEWIIKIVDFRDFNPALPDVVKSVFASKKLINAE